MLKLICMLTSDCASPIQLLVMTQPSLRCVHASPFPLVCMFITSEVQLYHAHLQSYSSICMLQDSFPAKVTSFWHALISVYVYSYNSRVMHMQARTRSEYARALMALHMRMRIAFMALIISLDSELALSSARLSTAVSLTLRYV